MYIYINYVCFTFLNITTYPLFGFFPMYSEKYNHFIRDLTMSPIQLDRKSLSDLAASEPASFKAILHAVKCCVPLTNVKLTVV